MTGWVITYMIFIFLPYLKLLTWLFGVSIAFLIFTPIIYSDAFSDYLCQIFWLIVIYFIKMSILFLYLRIFPDIPLFRHCVIGTMVFTTVAILILVPMAIWQCVPIHTIWDLKREDAKCLNVSGIAYASAGVNIATEIAILILPLPLLRTLRATISEKVALYALFGCGIL